MTSVFSRGDYFTIMCSITDADNNPLTVDVSAMRSQVRDEDGNLLAELRVKKLPDAGKYELFSPVDTSQWPLGKAFTDIEININGRKIHTRPIFEFTIEETITKPLAVVWEK